jgi:hypothetical protein
MKVIIILWDKAVGGGANYMAYLPKQRNEDHYALLQNFQGNL